MTLDEIGKEVIAFLHARGLTTAQDAVVAGATIAKLEQMGLLKIDRDRAETSESRVLQ